MKTMAFAGLLAVAAVVASAPQPTTSLQLDARVSGTGDPVVLLGGGLLGADGWGQVPDVLGQRHRVLNLQSVAVAYGLSGKELPGDYSLQTEVDALRRTLDAHQVKVADVIGMSHGGVTAMLFALQQPQRVRTITLIEPPAFWVLPNHGRDDPGAREMQELVSSLRHGEVREEHVEHFRCLLGDCRNGRSPRQLPQWPQWVKYRNSLKGLHTIGDYNGDLSTLRQLTMPALIVTGADTVSFHQEMNRILLRTLPRAEPLELSAGHNSPAAEPQQFVDAWSQFRERAASAR